VELHLETIKLGIRDEPLGVVARIRAINDTKWRSPSGNSLAGIALKSGTCAVGNIESLVRSGAVDRIWDEGAPAELFKCDLTLSKLLVDKTQLVVLKQDLQAHLVVDDFSYPGNIGGSSRLVA